MGDTSAFVPVDALGCAAMPGTGAASDFNHNGRVPVGENEVNFAAAACHIAGKCLQSLFSQPLCGPLLPLPTHIPPVA